MRRSFPLVAMIAVLSFALGGIAFANHDFSDVPDAHPFHDDISWMASSGVAEGFSDGTYRPGQPVTRQAMAAFLHRLSGDVDGAPRVVDAQTLADRTAADFDNAATLNLQTNEQLQPEVRYARTNASTPITGTNLGTANTIVTVTGLAAGTHVVDVTGSWNTGYDFSQMNCLIHGATVLSPPDSLNGMLVSSVDTYPLAGTAVIDLATAGNISLRCYTLVNGGGPSTVSVGVTSIVVTSVEDL